MMHSRLTLMGLALGFVCASIPLPILAQDEAPAGYDQSGEGGGSDVPPAGGSADEPGAYPAGDGDAPMAGGGDMGTAMTTGVYTKGTWPLELTKRPMTLIKGVMEIRDDFLPVPGHPAFTRMPIFYGVADKLNLLEPIISLNLDGKNPGVVMMLRMNGSVSFFQAATAKINPSDTHDSPVLNFVSESAITPLSPYESFLETMGDDAYVRSTDHIYVSRDHKSWDVDSAWLGGLSIYAMALDSAQNVFVCTNKGIYKQAPHGSVWDKLAAFGDVFTNKIYIDRADRFFISTSKGVFRSIDGGGSFQPDSAGMGSKSPTAYGDDAQGNVYATVEPNLIYRSLGGTQAWEKVGGGLEALAYGDGIRTMLTGIAGDSLVQLFTAVGVYFSADQGMTFKRRDAWITEGNYARFLTAKDGSTYVGNSLGVYCRKVGELGWKRVFPDSGFLPQRPIFEDTASGLYTLGRKFPGKNFLMPMIKAGPSDPWKPDTAGVSGASLFNSPLGSDGFYYVEPSGTQHLADIWGAGAVPQLWTKKIGESWKLDSAGIPEETSLSQPTAWGNDKDGNLYMAMSVSGGLVLTKPAAGGPWSLDTAGLGTVGIYCFAAGKDGKLWAGGIGGLYFREGGKWQKAGTPSADFTSSAVFALTVDQNGSVFAGYSDFQFSSNKSKGVYFSDDAGKTWTLIGMRNVTPKSLYAASGKVFATTYGQGAYILDKSKPVSARKSLPGPATAVSLRIISQPLSGRKIVVVNMPSAAHADLEILDTRGRIVEKPYSGFLSAGYQSIGLDVEGLREGVYIGRLSVAGMKNRMSVKFIR